MATPWGKEEYKNSEYWARKAKAGELNVIPCISGWMDICGFGAALEIYSWNLVELQKSGLLSLLSTVYQRVAHPFLVGVEPMPYESILVINDGISRTVDLDKPEFADAAIFIFYLRDLLFAHRSLIGLTNSYGYGIRTIFAGGERVQYSPNLYTGNMVLQHNNENISAFGKALLEKNFLHNPSEFQMNTAFAKAYSIDSLGSKRGFSVNNCYIETSFWEKIEAIPSLNIEKKESSVLIYFDAKPALEIFFSAEIEALFKGLKLQASQIVAMRVDEAFEGEETYCDITKA